MEIDYTRKITHTGYRNPEKIKKYQFLILAAMMVMYMAVIALYLLGMDRSMLM